MEFFLRLKAWQVFGASFALPCVIRLLDWDFERLWPLDFLAVLFVYAWYGSVYRRLQCAFTLKMLT